MKLSLPFFRCHLVGLALLTATAPSHAGEFTNHTGMKFVDIPAGSFFMGACKLSSAQATENRAPASPTAPAGSAVAMAACPSGTASDPEAYDDETPQHLVKLRAFQLGKTEVTLGQFKRFIQATGNLTLMNDDFRKYNDTQGDYAPVVHVNWHDAQAFVQWLNQSKPKSDRGVYRLPSEAEWEYAARGGTKTRFYFGEGLDKKIGQYVWYDKNAGDRQRTVGGKKPNAFGLHDMLGNVWEWTEDCWNESYRNAPSDGSAWTRGECGKRVVRGGSWFDVPIYLRASVRFGDRADRRINYDGFRVARTLP